MYSCRGDDRGGASQGGKGDVARTGARVTDRMDTRRGHEVCGRMATSASQERNAVLGSINWSAAARAVSESCAQGDTTDLRNILPHATRQEWPGLETPISSQERGLFWTEKAPRV